MHTVERHLRHTDNYCWGRRLSSEFEQRDSDTQLWRKLLYKRGWGGYLEFQRRDCERGLDYRALRLLYRAVYHLWRCLLLEFRHLVFHRSMHQSRAAASRRIALPGVN